MAVQLSTYSTQMQAAEQKRKDAEAEYKSAMETRKTSAASGPCRKS